MPKPSPNNKKTKQLSSRMLKRWKLSLVSTPFSMPKRLESSISCIIKRPLNIEKLSINGFYESFLTFLILMKILLMGKAFLAVGDRLW